MTGHLSSLTTGLAQVIGWTLAAVVLGSLLYPLLQLARTRGWCEFAGTSVHDFRGTLQGMLTYSNVPSRSPSSENIVAWAQNALPGGIPAGLEDLVKGKKDHADRGRQPQSPHGENGVQRDDP